MRVNTEPSTKAGVLRELRLLSGTGISGEALARGLGVSRVAVWKAVEALKTAGYAVRVDEDGYSLRENSSDDFLYPWEFGARESRIRHFVETTSTMDRAKEEADRGARPFTVVVAERQTAGRGRAGREWESGAGGLFCTILLPAGMRIMRYGRVALAVQLLLAKSIKKQTGVEALPRWPNDVYAAGKKIAGALVELEGEGDRTRRMAVGVGVNVRNRPKIETAVSCADVATRPITRKNMLEAFLDELEAAPFDPDADRALIASWNAQAEGVGRPVRIVGSDHRDELASGVFRGVDELGRAAVETNGGIRFVEPGAASLRF